MQGGNGVVRKFPYDTAPIALITIFVVITSIVRWHLGVSQLSFGSVLANANLMLISLIFAGGFYILWVLAAHRPDMPIAFLRSMAREHDLPERLLRAAPLLLATAVFMPAFSGIKASIPYMNAFTWDPAFTRWDSMIHGGDAWKLLYPILQSPFATFLISMAYQSWLLLVCLGVPLIILWHEGGRLRAQFLLSYFLSWLILGTVSALAFASVGPCFVDYFYGSAHFQPLMDRLVEIDRHYPLLALDVQNELIAWQQQNSTGLGRGISAMPSMHVSIATLFAILGWQVSKSAGLALTAFLLVIQTGSVLLGYHYAIDGYVSAVGTLIIWWFCGKMVAVSDELRRPKSLGEVKPA
ncbi:phosphatase PAP2 family protein [Rhizorhapis sp. SPR117]|uniref:phosphatase PAP2 family protein n=1 Tax=Rhizorhapis sp. SPR117 TaxID=2912611 RepID=UPI001F3A39C3|nr:phosphatase PAP2 family protein [Rhizorhapis sp. SPR117]